LGVVEQFLNHIQRHKLCKPSDKILLAVSGGLDSMVMLHLFIDAGFQVGVAHCNFQLRGEDSKADEALVNDVCIASGIPFHLQRFETSQIAEREKKSIQVVARDLRYHFFKETSEKLGYKVIATAHHLNDSFETVLLNLVRGTGIDGLKGIPVRNGNVVRPMLFASRQAIKDHAEFLKLRWREDASNETDDYQRNFLRHHIVPGLVGMNPNLVTTFKDTAERIAGIGELVSLSLLGIRNEICVNDGTRTRIGKAKLQRYQAPHVILWELLKSYGFNFDQCKLICEDHQPGRKFTGDQAVLTVDREDYLLEPLSTPDLALTTIDETQTTAAIENTSLYLRKKQISEFLLVKDNAIAQLDADKLKFPLTWRTWRPGDSMTPLGMNSRKKISDMLIDSKIPLPDKAKVTVLESAGDIVWLVGHRIHEGYKVTHHTQNVMIIEIQ
jgi:tRNA(Ile)-lysidine synthase